MFRLANVAGRAALVEGEGWHDLERATSGQLPADPMEAIRRHRELHDVDLAGRTPDGSLDGAALGPPSPRPRSVFGIGLNYRDHAREARLPLPEVPMVFTKFPSCLAGPHDRIGISGDRVDWEVELVVIVGDGGRHIPEEAAWDHLAAITCGQDVSDRRVQGQGEPPQFSMGKSFDGYGPTGPVAVSVDSFDDPDDIGLSCEVSGELMQDGRTNDLVFGVPQLVGWLSSICTLAPGDLIFTGTPAGVGLARGRFLQAGDEIVSRIDQVGSMRNLVTDGRST